MDHQNQLSGKLIQNFLQTENTKRIEIFYNQN